MSEEPAREVESTPSAAPAPAAKQEYPFKVLSVFSTGVRMARRNFSLFLLLACLMVVPGLIGQYGNPLLGMVVQAVTSSVATAFVTYAVVLDMSGSQRPSVGACIAQGFSSFGHVLAVSIVSGLVIFAATLLLIIPGIVVALMFLVIVPVTVIEKVGPGEAMKRSRELTSGRKGDLFVLMMLVGLLFIPVVVIATQLDPSSLKIWFSVVSGVFAAFMSVLSAVVYVVLRQLRDGTQVPELATAFARIVK